MSGCRQTHLVIGLALFLAGLFTPQPAGAQESVEYYGTDAIGSVRIVFDANGNILGRMDYGPFGEQLSASTVGHKSYAGLFRDGEAGLDYAEARSYQVRTGRFSAPDPVYDALFNPQAWNRYNYALNSPASVTDATGLQAEGPRNTNTGGCSAEYSFQKCGGEDLFWNTGGFGFEFGNDFAGAQDRGYVPGMPRDIWESLQDWLSRAESAFDRWREESRELQPVITSETVWQLDRDSSELKMAVDPRAAALSAVATAVATNLPRGAQAAAVWGTRVHTAFRTRVESLNLPGVRTEVSYRAGQIVDWGVRGSVRLDAVIMQGNQILQIFDLKTGNAGMSLYRVQQIMSQLPRGQSPPITVIRP
jgi:RHS repeat-associated protein